MGIRWSNQTLQLDSRVTDVIQQLRDAAREGRLVREEWDHNSPGYNSGRSNKRIMIAGSIVLDRPQTTLTMDDAWNVMLELAFGRHS